LVFGRKKSLASSLRTYRQRYIYYDPYEVGSYVRKLVAEYVGKKRPDQLIYILEDLLDVRRMFPFNGLIASITYVIESIVDDVVQLRVPKRYMRQAMETLVRLYERADEEFVRRSAHMLSSEILSGSTAAVPTGGLLLEKVLFEVRAKLDGMLVPMGEPLLLGAKFAAKMHKSGINSLYVPDSARGWLVSKSDFTIIPLYGLTLEGHIVTEPGTLPLVRQAWDQEKRVFAVGPRTAFYPVERAGDLLASSLVDLGGGLRVRAADIVDPDEGPVFLATDREVLRVSKDFLVEEAKHVREALEEMAMNVLATIYGRKERAG